MYSFGIDKLTCPAKESITNSSISTSREEKFGITGSSASAQIRRLHDETSLMFSRLNSPAPANVNTEQPELNLYISPDTASDASEENECQVRRSRVGEEDRYSDLITTSSSPFFSEGGTTSEVTKNNSNAISSSRRHEQGEMFCSSTSSSSVCNTISRSENTGDKTSSNTGHPSRDKPPHSYIALISRAILSSPRRKLVLSDIYQYVMDHFAYYDNHDRAWRNSIRHNLSLNECFIKDGRAENGKGNFWAIHPACVDDFSKGDYRRRHARRRARGSAYADLTAAPTGVPYSSRGPRMLPLATPFLGFPPYHQPLSPNFLSSHPALVSYPPFPRPSLPHIASMFPLGSPFLTSLVDQPRSLSLALDHQELVSQNDNCPNVEPVPLNMAWHGHTASALRYLPYGIQPFWGN